MPTIRTFLALPASRDVQHQMTDVQSKLKATQADVKWEVQDKFHITLKFLGDIEQSDIESLSSSLAKTAKQFPIFEITYNSLGAFPSPQHPRIVWIGTEPNELINSLQAAVERACAEFGFQKEERAFHPHITIGRVKGSRSLVRLTEAIKTVTFEPIQSHCSEVLLMKSELRSSGSLYTILKSISLQS